MGKILRDSRFWLLLILVLAAFLRFYRLSDYLQFLGDEGRDVLVVKRMIVNHKFTLLGPTASVGGFYTGPIYYYFMLPFLWLFQLDPVGPAVMAALFGLATIILIYYAGKIFFDEKAGLIAALLVAISPKMIDISRFSWNPNPVPFFALAAVVTLYFAAVKKRALWTILSGLSVGVLVQLHYIDLIFIPIIGVAMLLVFPWKEWWKQALLLAMSFLLGNSLFIVFELRHGFPNTRSVIEFITRKGQTVAPRSNNLIWLFQDIYRRLFETVLTARGNILNLLAYSSLGIFFGWVIKSVSRENRIKAILPVVWLIIGIFGVGSYQGTLFDHYFNYLFPLPFLFLGLAGSLLLSRKYFWPVFLLFLGVIFYMEIPQWYLWHKPNNLVEQTKGVDRVVLALTRNQPYNFALITPGNSDQAYRYFLEIWNRPPLTIENPAIDPQRKTVAGQLVVICEGPCAPLGNPLWEVAGFGRAEIAERVTGPVGITIYRLVHYNGT